MADSSASPSEPGIVQSPLVDDTNPSPILAEGMQQEMHPLTAQAFSALPLLGSHVAPLIESQLGGKCYRTIVLDLAITDSPCLQLLISKALGFGIVIFGSMVKVPQILKLLSSRRVSGVSFTSYLLEAIASSIFVAYNARNNNPFSTFGESAFINIQNLIIMALICLLKGRYYGMATITVMWAILNATLLYNDVLSLPALEILSGAVIPLSLFSKVPQIMAIAKVGHVRNLSSLTIAAYFAGSLARVYTTLQEVDDKIILASFVLTSFLNLVLVAQVSYYKFIRPRKMEKQLSEVAAEAEDDAKNPKVAPSKSKKSKKLD